MGGKNTQARLPAWAAVPFPVLKLIPANGQGQENKHRQYILSLNKLCARHCSVLGSNK